MIKSLKHLNSAYLDNATLADQFTDLAPALNARQAQIESERCLYCFDAPCTRICPTEIDVASFIRNIATENINGAAQTILQQNILGGSCARVCPTEILCEDACVRNHDAEGVRFYTRVKAVMQRWPNTASVGAEFAFPQMK